MHIAVSLCNELATQHGREVTALGIGYDMTEHNWPFQIIPVGSMEFLGHIPAILHNFRHLHENGRWKPVEAVVVAMDVPVQDKLLQIDRAGIPYVGVFPVESGPFCATWATSIARMNERLVISEFGEKMIQDSGISAGYLPVGIDTESWRRPEPDERKTIRKSLGFEDDEFVVLTVADNQERKNLSAAAEIISRARKKINAKWVLVTRVGSPVGWKLGDMAVDFDIGEHMTAFDRGLPFDRLWILYAAADAFLLTSKAEGLCLPILEAMSCGVPVLATECTAVPEHIYQDPDWNRLEDGKWNKGRPKGQRGFSIPVEFTTIDPWGNSVRSFANPKEGAKALVNIAKMNPRALNDVVERSMEYARERTWHKAGTVLNDTINKAIAGAKLEASAVADAPQIPAGLPAVMPRPVPIMQQEGQDGGNQQDEN